MKLIVQRVKKDYNFTIISNSLFLDPELSLDAKAFFTLILTLPPTWDFSVAGMVKYTRKSKLWVNKVLHELIEKGLCIREQAKTGAGKFAASQYTFIERHSNSRTTPLKQCGSHSEIAHPVQPNAGIMVDANRPLENREPGNRPTVLEHNTSTDLNKNTTESNNSQLSLSSPSSSTMKKIVCEPQLSQNSVMLSAEKYDSEFRDEQVGTSGKCAHELIEPRWDQILPLEDCAAAFSFSKEMAERRRELVALAKLRDEERLLEFIAAFNSHLLCEGHMEKQYQDWKNHFSNWLRLQDPNGPFKTNQEFNRQQEKIRNQIINERDENGRYRYKPYQPYSPNPKTG